MALKNTEQYSTSREAGFETLEWEDTEKRFWRCIVCNDVHYGAEPPRTCPTCMARNTYVEIDPQTGRKVMIGVGEAAETGQEELIRRWEDLAERNKQFDLHPDREEVVELAAKGVLRGEEEKGLKYCPCQMKTGDFVKDLGLVCPCNFFIQPSWDEKGECWCKLFVSQEAGGEEARDWSF